MAEIDFHKIVPRCGSKHDAFEELCCQIAAKKCPPGSSFTRIRGAGGDGGVECYARQKNGKLTGWQAKFVFDVDALLKQAGTSLATALKLHPALEKYVVCFPFDLSGKKNVGKRKNVKSGQEKFDSWVSEQTRAAKKSGRKLTIVPWSASTILGDLATTDSSGGIRHYFFDATILTTEWFSSRIETALAAAGPRYSADLNVETPLMRWFSAFAADDSWRSRAQELAKECTKTVARVDSDLKYSGKGNLREAFPAKLKSQASGVVKKSQALIAECGLLLEDLKEDTRKSLIANLGALWPELNTLEQDLITDLETVHGKGRANSKGFRTFMAEYQVSFPAANLDNVREVITAFNQLETWLNSPEAILSTTAVFILSGAGGAGKTHGICDVAQRRLNEGALSVIVFGHAFSGEPEPWARLRDTIGLPATLGTDAMLDALSAAAEASGRDLFVFVDAINETRPRDYWFDRLVSFARPLLARPRLKLCVSCRTSFLPFCVPSPQPFPAFEHQGFVGVEREACNAFFRHYKLEPPLVPILQPELSNPLYLKLVCETLNLRGEKRLPNGWLGLSPVIKAFLEEKEKLFAREHGTSPGAAIVRKSLLAIASAIASGGSTVSWAQADAAIRSNIPQAADKQVIEWLVRADLLIEDVAPLGGGLTQETVLRPAFERFGDFLIAEAHLPSIAFGNWENASRPLGDAEKYVQSEKSVSENAGVLSALSVMIPEREPGVELTELIDDPAASEATLRLTVRALPWRTTETFTPSTCRILRQALNLKGSWSAMDAMLAVTALPSPIDAFWFHSLLQAVPLAKRDSFWCPYLKSRFESSEIVARLVEATMDMPLEEVTDDVAKRWALILLWFTAAADRRVKDNAARAANAILRAKPQLILPTIQKLLYIDDDEVRERAILCGYGALLVSRNVTATKETAEFLLKTYNENPKQFQNALIRDDIRCIAEFAAQLRCLDKAFDPEDPNKQMPSDFPLKMPTADVVKGWRDEERGVMLISHSCLSDDFNHYSINCLSQWFSFADSPKIAVGQWIANHAIEELGFRGSGCSAYDEREVSVTGGGRSKPVWAERIGKKYQWIALYRLASRLHDNIKPKKEYSSEPDPLRRPLILGDERKHEPTLPQKLPDKSDDRNGVWIKASVDLRRYRSLTHAQWVAKKDDIPSLADILAPVELDGQRWHTLLAFPGWSNRPKDAEHHTVYRDVWMHVRAYLVPEKSFETTRTVLADRNFFNKWMPEDTSWLHAFAGEYPWGTSFNTEPDWYLGAEDKIRDTSIILTHASNELTSEWEYDPTCRSIYFSIPTRIFFKAGDMYWNGRDGFSTPGGKTVFKDPSVSLPGSRTLLAEIGDLSQRLKKLRLRLLWTFLGEKLIIGDNNEPRVTFSQIAWLDKSGEMRFGKRNFFTDYEKNVGLPGTMAEKRASMLKAQRTDSWKKTQKVDK